MKAGMGRGASLDKVLAYPEPTELCYLCNTAISYNTDRVFNIPNPTVSATKRTFRKVTYSSSINVQDPKFRIWSDPDGYVYPFVWKRTLPYYKGWDFMDSYWYGCPTLQEDPWYGIVDGDKSTYPCFRQCSDHETDWFGNSFPLLAYCGYRNAIPYNNTCVKSPRFNTFFTNSGMTFEHTPVSNSFRAWMIVKSQNDFGVELDPDDWIIFPSVLSEEEDLSFAMGLLIRTSDGTIYFKKPDWASVGATGYVNQTGGFGFVIDFDLIDPSGGDIYIDPLFGLNPAEYTDAQGNTLPPNMWSEGYVPSNLPDINESPGIGGDMDTWIGYMGGNGLLDTEEFKLTLPSSEFITTGDPPHTGSDLPSGLKP